MDILDKVNVLSAVGFVSGEGIVTRTLAGFCLHRTLCVCMYIYIYIYPV